ncbi:MAG TPA: sigma factor-like helix-turn-helix DNA-binding protein [Candidatus Margulisiibacteriota bacterium]|nr:sigma factor-like helix-turn-helix DNA-binding protein [Candidatus Margulisiibacteriota bacterium]
MTLVAEYLSRLSGKEEQVVRLLFGIGEAAHSRDELVRRLGLSRASLRQIEHRALRHLRCAALSHDSAALPGRNGSLG